MQKVDLIKQKLLLEQNAADAAGDAIARAKIADFTEKNDRLTSKVIEY
jgi:hypothetical protein